MLHCRDQDTALGAAASDALDREIVGFGASEVNTMSAGLAPIRSAICSRDSSTVRRAWRPAL